MVGRLHRDVGSRVFGQDAEGYDAFRPIYPDIVYDRLAERCGDLAGKAVFEVGPGTGFATAALLDRKIGSLLAIEPDVALACRLADGMKDERLHVRAAPFERNRAPAAAFDAGIAATCFHWVEKDIGLREVRRLLKPGSQWAMWWNIYRTDTELHPFVLALKPYVEDLAQGPQEGPNGHIALDTFARTQDLAEAGFEAIEPLVTRQDLSWTAAGIRGLYSTFSFVRSLDDERRLAVLRKIEEIAEREFGGSVPNPVLTAAYFATSP